MFGYKVHSKPSPLKHILGEIVMFIYWVFVKCNNTYPDDGLYANNTFSNALFAIIHCVCGLRIISGTALKKTSDADEKWVDTVLEKDLFYLRTLVILYES